MSIRAIGWTAVCLICKRDYGDTFDGELDADNFDRESGELCAECADDQRRSFNEHGRLL